MHLQYSTSHFQIQFKFITGPIYSQVYDKHWESTVEAEVTVVVRRLPREAVLQSGSLRIRHLTAEQFVTPTDQNVSSPAL